MQYPNPPWDHVKKGFWVNVDISRPGHGAIFDKGTIKGIIRQKGIAKRVEKVEKGSAPNGTKEALINSVCLIAAD